MRHICAVGLQWGDEGKGKIVDVLSQSIDAVVRYQGGANAGHTIYIGDERKVLHHLPTGVLRDGTLAILGNGMVIDPITLLRELSALPAQAVDRVYFSDRAHIVLPHHGRLDQEREQGSRAPIGTTRRGIGPAYEDKCARVGVRLGEVKEPGFLDGELAARLRARGFPDGELAAAKLALAELLERAGARILDTAQLLRDLDRQGKRFLFECAQGAMLDVDFGTYPYVTSSNASFLGLGAGSGFSPRKIDHVLGITKAYCTRVGAGPFPSEAEPAEAEALRERGNEFGSTTGRPRRCGWLDLPALRYAIALNDVDSLALTKADVLNGRRTVPVVMEYRKQGRRVESFPGAMSEFEGLQPVYEEWPGWQEPSRAGMGAFIDRLARETGKPVTVLSTGRRRDQVDLTPPFAPAGGRGECKA